MILYGAQEVRQHPDEYILYLPGAWQSLDTPRFSEILKQELQSLSLERLPLQQCMRQSSHILDHGMQVLILGMTDMDAERHIRIGVFFSGIIAGCSCADDPTPVEPINEYCELLLRMNKSTGRINVESPTP